MTRTPHRLTRRARLAALLAATGAGALTIGLIAGVDSSAQTSGTGTTVPDPNSSTSSSSDNSSTDSSSTDSSSTGGGIDSVDQGTAPQGGSNGS